MKCHMKYHRSIKITDKPYGYWCEVQGNIWKHVNQYGEIKSDLTIDNSKVLDLIMSKKVVVNSEPIKFDVVNSIDSEWMN